MVKINNNAHPDGGSQEGEERSDLPLHSEQSALPMRRIETGSNDRLSENCCKIKICGLVKSDVAYKAAILGANFIGIVFHAPSKRVVNLQQAKEIATATKLGGAEPVAVFTTHSAVEMQDICTYTQITTVQLQGDASKNQYSLLPENYSRIYALTIFEKEPPGLNLQKDYLLFDNLQPGSGLTFDWEKFVYSGQMNYGLAGGLSAENVSAAIKKIKPSLVDVSSGVENSLGKKDLVLIEKFIRSVKEVVL